MKTQSNIYPEQIIVDLNGDVILTENVIEVAKDDGIGYEYDSYRINVPYRQNLKQSIEANFADWLDFAKAESTRPSDKEIAEAEQTLKVFDILMEVGLL